MIDPCINEAVACAVEYNGRAMASDKGAVISNSNRTTSSLNRAMANIREHGHEASYKIGIISISVDGEEVYSYGGK